jgi:hypothetical protein
MNPVDLIAAALADGVDLRLEGDSLKASGDSAAVSKWAALIRPNKASIIASLKVGAGDMAMVKSCGWRLHYVDRDPVHVFVLPEPTHDEVLETHPDAVAAEPITLSDVLVPAADGSHRERAHDLRHCRECQHLRGEVCTVASPGDIVSANKGYRPWQGMPKRCGGFSHAE